MISVTRSHCSGNTLEDLAKLLSMLLKVPLIHQVSFLKSKLKPTISSCSGIYKYDEVGRDSWICVTFIVRFIREVMMGCHSIVSENVP